MTPSDLTFNSTLRQRLVERLADFEYREEPPGDSRLAAVALAVVPDEAGAASLVITRRCSTLRHHGGQFALPGGRVDPGESLTAAALRELEEEVGLDLPESAVLGRLDDYPTRSGFVMTPVVVWGPEQPMMRPNPGEVEAIFRSPLDEMAHPKAAKTPRLPFAKRPLITLSILDTLLFAPTAAVLYQFAELAVHGRTTRVKHFDQPRFAWK
jgi:8-oxo-dGTP pyrophosphatase MutT (NUDIX family)